MNQSNIQVGNSATTILNVPVQFAKRFGYGVFNHANSAGAVTVASYGVIGTQSVQLKTESINANASGGGVVDCEGYESVSIVATAASTATIDLESNAKS